MTTSTLLIKETSRHFLISKLSTQMMYSLSDMPDVPMDLILKYVGFPTILSLQKVSSNFRNYIEEKKPDVKLSAIDIIVEYEEVRVNWICNSESTEVCYKHHKNGYMVTNGSREKSMEHWNYIDAFRNDFKQTMAYQKSVLKRFHVDLRSTAKTQNLMKFVKKFEHALKSIPVKTVYLDFGVCSGNELMAIFPYLDADFLKEVRLFSTSFYERKVHLDEVVKLEQWKNLRKFSTRNLTIDVSMEHFTHFSIINAEVKPLYAEDLEVLRQAAIQSTSFEMFHIEYHDFNDDRRLAELFGIPFRRIFGSNNKKQWFFNTCNPGKVLEVTHWQKFDRINFSLIGVNSVPDGAEIKD